MPKQAVGQKTAIKVPAVEGMNTFSNWNVAKKSEFSHVENGRCLKVGTIEKRDGDQLLDSHGSITSQGLFWYPDAAGADNQGIYNVAGVGNIRSVEYQNASGVWLDATNLSSFNYAGSGGTEVDITELSGPYSRFTYNGTGADPNFHNMCKVGENVTISGSNFDPGNVGTFEITASGTDYFEVLNSGTDESNIVLDSSNYIYVAVGDHDHTYAEGNMYLANGITFPMRVNGEVGTKGNVTGSDLFGCPRGNKINLYKGKLYVADYKIGSKRFQNHVQMSSPLLGIVTLVDGDHVQKYSGNLTNTTLTEIAVTNPYADIHRYTWTETGFDPSFDLITVGATVTVPATDLSSGNEGDFVVTAVGTNFFEVDNSSGVVETDTVGTSNLYSVVPANVTVKVSDTKYIETIDSLDVYRGNTLITTLTVSAKSETEITVDSIPVALNSSDEIWIADTKTGVADPQFRWVDNPAVGTNVKRYDTFPVSGGTNGRIKMMENVGDVMAVASKDNISLWNGYSLQSVDLGIGCVSDNGWVKNNGLLFFLDYDGIYMTDGGLPKLISTPVDDIIQGSTTANREASYAFKKGFSVFFTLGDVTLTNADGSTGKTLSDCWVEYDLRKDLFFTHTGFAGDFPITVDLNDDPTTVVYQDPDENHALYEMLKSETLLDHLDINGAGDSGSSEIIFRADSQKFQLSDFGKAAYVHKIVAVVDRGHAIQCFVSPDDEEWYELKDQFNKGISTIAVHGKDEDASSPLRCENLRISFRDAGKKKCKISGYEIYYVLTDEVAKDENLRRQSGTH